MQQTFIDKTVESTSRNTEYLSGVKRYKRNTESYSYNNFSFSEASMYHMKS